jgi:hypothetical protein
VCPGLIGANIFHGKESSSEKVLFGLGCNKIGVALIIFLFLESSEKFLAAEEW